MFCRRFGEVGGTLRSDREHCILCHLRVYVPLLGHLDHVSDNIFKIFVHIRNQNTFFYIPIKIYNTNLLVTLLTEYLTTLRGRCHWVQNAMTTPWHHKKLRRLTYGLQKENN